MYSSCPKVRLPRRVVALSCDFFCFPRYALAFSNNTANSSLSNLPPIFIVFIGFSCGVICATEGIVSSMVRVGILKGPGYSARYSVPIPISFFSAISFSQSFMAASLPLRINVSNASELKLAAEYPSTSTCMCMLLSFTFFL